MSNNSSDSAKTISIPKGGGALRALRMVEQESIEGYSVSGLHSDGSILARVERQNFSPPTLNKTWFHQGPIGNGLELVKL